MREELHFIGKVQLYHGDPALHFIGKVQLYHGDQF